MAQTIKLRRSATAGATPTTSQLELGEVAINTYDGKMYIKKSVGGTESIVELGSGLTPADAILEEYLYTATASQTAFSGNDDNSDFLSYTAGALQVFLNGILLDPETDYTATNGATITLTAAAALNDYLQIFAFKKKIGDSSITINSFTGNNSTTAYTLTLDPGDENNTRVFIDGVYQSKSNYTVSGTTLTFSSAPPSGTGIEVEIGNRAVSLDTASNLDLPDNVKLRLGTGQDLQLYHTGSASILQENGTGTFYIQGTDIVFTNSAGSERYADFTDNGAVRLYHDNSIKLATASTGVDVTGNIAVTGTVDGRDVASDGAAAVAALPRTGGAMTGAITTNSTFDGRDVATDGSKLDGIEAGATADQTQSEINALGITATGLSGTPAISVANITTTGELRGPASFTIDPAAVGDNTGTVIIKGNLQVDGATTTINSTTLTVDDLNLTLASGAANGTAANGAGITIDGASATLTYASAGDNWAFNKNLDVTGNIVVSGTVDGVDIAARDAVLTSTTTTANAALPKAGGTMTGNLAVPNLSITSTNWLGFGDYGERISGSNGNSSLTFYTDATLALTLDSSQNATFAGDVGMATGHSSGKFAVMSSSVHGSYDFYNNGTSYFNGSVIVDDVLNVTGTNKAIQMNGVTRINGVGDIIGTSYYVGGTNVIDTSRNLTNIGTISSGAITSTELTITGGADGADVYINNTSPTLAFTDSNSFSDANDMYIIRGASTGKLQFNWYDDSANTTTQTFLIDQSGNTTFAGTLTSGAITSSGNITFGDSHTIGDDADDNLEIASSSGENIIVKSTDGIYLRTGGNTNALILNSSQNATFSGTISSGAITSTGKVQGNSLKAHVGTDDGQQLNLFANASGHCFIAGHTLSFNVGANNGRTTKLALDSSGNATFSGTISSGAITITADGADLIINSVDEELVLLGNRGSTGTNLDAGYLRMKAQGVNKVILDTEGVSYLNGGNVGIGTTAPAALLHLKSTANSVGPSLIFENTNNAQSMNIDYWNNAGAVQSRIEYAEGPASWNFIPNTSNNNSALYIAYSGNVGIGTDAPVGTLDVRSTNAVGSVFRKDFNGPVADTFSKVAVTLWGQDHDDADVGTGTDQFGPMLGFGARIDDGNPNSGDVRAGISYSYNGDLTFHAKAGASVADGSYERIRIDGATGNVGINHDAPSKMLAVNVASDSDGIFLYSNKTQIGSLSRTTVGSTVVTSLDGNTGRDIHIGGVVNTDVILANAGGNVGIGTIDPVGNLHIVGGDGVNGSSTIGTASNEFIIENNSDAGLTIRSGADAGGVISFADPDDHNVGQVYYSHDTDKMSIVTNDAVQMTIDSAGTVDVVNDILTNNAKLKAIAESNTDTAVDVFVYDTRKDSDGGAWRKRTQNTSWYNETLNTSTRGARKEFPCVAVIVADSNRRITIYDGDDPDMPMWMKPSSTDSWIWANSDPFSCVSAKNGIIALGQNGSTHRGIRMVDFVRDSAWFSFTQTGATLTQYIFLGGASSTGGSTVNQSNTSYWWINGGIVNAYVNDVAMTVLPNAPIDADTGLPVPTIAVATDGGVSVIKDDGTVVDIVSSYLGHETPMQVKFVGDKVFWLGQNNYDNGWSSAFTAKIPSADLSVNYNTGVGSLTKYSSFEWGIASSNGSDISIPIAMNSPRTSVLLEAGTNDELILGGKGADDHGTVVKVVENLSDPESGMLAQIGSDFATGYQVGDIKLATLSDTDTTNVTGSELISGGNFSNWTTRGGAGFTVNGNGTASLSNGDGTTDGWLDSPSFSTVNGKTYVVRIETSSNSGTGFGIYYNYGNGPNGYQFSRTFTFVANGGTTTLSLYRYLGHSGTGTLDSISVRLAEADRSVNGNGVQVFGTVTKTAVATGAELVGYSGFSSSNYLQQPYNSDLDFGTGDFSIVGWIKPVASTTVQLILNRRKLDGSGTPIELGINSDETPYLYTGGGSTPLTGSPLPVGTWLHIVAVRQGGFVGIYVNGKLFNSNTGQNVNNVSLTDAHTLIGGYITNGGRQYPWQGSMALLRMSATIPSLEQIAKMYNDEKHLFATNAKATLYGTSDAVTALAYDDDTELLHVGTSAGRSVFQGLNRVDNTTDAVSAAISASNGFIVEE